MEILGVSTARLLAFLNADEINPAGLSIAHDFSKAFVERYHFLTFPQGTQDMDESKGITFENGKWDKYGISKFVLFSWGIVIDTNSSTEVSESVLQDMLTWGVEKFGLSNRPDLVTRRGYLSEIVFTSDLSLAAINPKIQALGAKVTDSISNHFRQKLDYEIHGISLHFDTRFSKQPFAPVRVERLDNTPFPDKKYYSGAPLPTKDHIQFLKDFEAALKG